MKKLSKIVLCIMIALTLLLLVACGESTESIDGYYYNVTKDGGVEVLKVENGSFGIYKFSPTTDDQTTAELLEVIKADPATYVANADAKISEGSCTYTDNSFVESRLDLDYSTEGKSSEYAYLKGDTFAYSPKLGAVCLYALIGFCITLVVLCVLMGIIKLLGICVEKISEKASKKKGELVDSGSVDVVEETKLAKGTAGDLTLENVSDRDAAMIMAIVADQLGEPLNTLRFKSIKDITDESDKE